MPNHPVVRVAFLDVGQGDTAVVSLPETKEAVIVDCVDANAVLDYLAREEIQHLRGVLVTHLHLDHYAGVVQLLNNIEHELNLTCERVLFHRPHLTSQLRDAILYDNDGHADGDQDNQTRARSRGDNIRGLLSWVKNHRERYNNLTIQPGIHLPLEGIMELIHPWEVDATDLLAHGLNNTSAVIRVMGSGSSVLLTGDVEPVGWEKLTQTASAEQLRGHVLKFPHHGAWRDRDVSLLLDVVEPAFVIISVGTAGIQYGHPNQHVFEAIARLKGVRLLCTQVTLQCSNHIENRRPGIIDTFKQRTESHQDFFTEHKGCPCAGTVIIELGDTVHVLQPRLDFHRDRIIKPNYEKHQCDLAV